MIIGIFCRDREFKLSLFIASTYDQIPGLYARVCVLFIEIHALPKTGLIYNLLTVIYIDIIDILRRIHGLYFELVYSRRHICKQ